MKLLLALFLTIPAVILAKDVKCPKDFFHVKRTPTARNNHTKDWCLGVFDVENVGDRDRARSFCISNDAMLSIPENKAEYDLIIERTKDKNASETHAMDGQMNPKCKALLFKFLQQDKLFNTTTLKGECNIKNNLVIFDDANTDPEFVLSHMKYGIPSGHSSITMGHGPALRKMDECLTMERTVKLERFFNTVSCDGKQLKSKEAKKLLYPSPEAESIIDSVICGRAPL